MLGQHPRKRDLTGRSVVLVRDLLQVVDEREVFGEVLLGEARERPPVVPLFEILPRPIPANAPLSANPSKFKSQ
jgi:hypothetical protein